MYDICRRIYSSYFLKSFYKYKPVINLKLNAIKNDALMEYARESLKKSIRKIEDIYKDPNYKLKCIAKDAIKEKDQYKDGSPLILGATYCFLLLLYINNANSN